MKRESKKRKGTKQSALGGLRVPWNGEYEDVKSVIVKDEDPQSPFISIYWVGSDGKEHIWGSTSRVVFNMIKAHFTGEGLTK